MFVEKISDLGELNRVGATRFAIICGIKKARIFMFKISDLNVSAALILKQEAISAGGDFIAPKDLILGENKRYSGILIATALQLEKIIAKCAIQPFGLKKLGTILEGHLEGEDSRELQDLGESCHFEAEAEKSKNLSESNNLITPPPAPPLTKGRGEVFISFGLSPTYFFEKKVSKKDSDSGDSKSDYLPTFNPKKYGNLDDSHESQSWGFKGATPPCSKSPSTRMCLSTSPSLAEGARGWAESQSDEFLQISCESKNLKDSRESQNLDESKTPTDSRKSKDIFRQIPQKYKVQDSRESCNKTLLNSPKMQTNKQIMGIINITEDSFYAPSRVNSIDKILQKIEAMINEGVAIIDIGAASSRPNSERIESQIELARLKEPIEAIFHAGFTQKAIFSIDTYNFECADFCANRGFQIINDIEGLRDKRLAKLALNSDKKVVLMHNSWLFPHEPQKSIIQNVDEFFASHIESLLNLGIKKEQIILDIGFGFGKNDAQNLALVRNLAHFKHFGCSLLVGASMKRTIGAIIDKDTLFRGFGTLALHQIALDNGANIIRCHDFSAHIDMLKVWSALNP